MRTSTILSMPLVLLIVVCILPSILPKSIDGGSDPLIEDDLVLEITSPIDSDPLLFSMVIPWSSGEPIITNVSFSISGSNFTELIGWQKMYVVEENRSIIDFSMHFDWGKEETILIRVTDNMGVNSTVGRTVICSRAPSVDILHNSEETGSYPGIHMFSASASDPDGQELTFQWEIDGIQASSSGAFSTYLKEGAHTISLEVSDGQWVQEKQIEVLISPINVEEDDEGMDMVWIISLIFLLVIACSFIVFSIYILLNKIQRSAVKREIMNGERKASINISSSTCDICLSKMKDGQSRTDCRCGAQFHKGCGRREGVCPECGREILI